jgi:hypothetical protein
MASSVLKFVRPSSLTHCVLDHSLMGRLKHVLWRRGINAERTRRQAAGTDLDPAARSTVRQLAEKGIVIGNVADFLSDSGLAAFREGEEAIRAEVASEKVQNALTKGRNSGQHKDYLIQIVNFNDPIDAGHPLLRLALDERLLNSVAAYMGMWSQLHAIGSWLNFPVDQDAKASQLWHRDPEDLKTVKVFIYLDDVGPKQGPFSFIGGSHPLGADCERRPEHQHPRRVLDHEMVKTFPEGRWTRCTGPAGTMIMADTVGYHRGGQVQEGHRLLITFTYTSGTPQETRKLTVTGQPSWQLSPIQGFALKN